VGDEGRVVAGDRVDCDQQLPHRSDERLRGDGTPAKVADGMRKAGVLIEIDGPAANVLKIRPPMPIQEAHADLLVAALDAQLRRL
jgi:4-aminobutyrate aminotransferase-like enzyme